MNGLFGGGDGTINNPYLVEDVDDLSNVRLNLLAHYKQVEDIDLSSTIWVSIGEARDTQFVGSYDGDGFPIKNLKAKPLFNYVKNGIIKNVKIKSVEIASDTDGGDLGALIASASKSSVISKCSVIGGNVSGGSASKVGGLIGQVEDCTITECYSDVSVSGSDQVGGLIGFTSGWDARVIVTESYAVGDVSCPGYASGGLVGYAENTDINSCYASGFVDGVDTAGGLIGGFYNITVISSYYDTQKSGQSDIDKGIPKTTVEMKKQATYINWDFTTKWTIKEGLTYPGFFEVIEMPEGPQIVQCRVIKLGLLTPLV